LESGDEDDEDMSDVDELIVADDDDEDFEEVDDFDGMEDDFDIAPKSSKPKMDPRLKKAKKMAASSADLFASAEEFSALIDENELDLGAGGIEQVLFDPKQNIFRYYLNIIEFTLFKLFVPCFLDAKGRNDFFS
jgi:hypothetical protein